MRQNIDNMLYQIGEVAKACGVTRRTILYYESRGLLIPSEINETSGYRYYSQLDVANLLLILELKNAGLSLDDIAEYISGKDVTEKQITQLEAQKKRLSNSIAELRSRQVKKGDYTVGWLELPQRLCFVRSFVCNGVEEAIYASYQTVGEAIRLGLRFSTSWNSFCEFPDDQYMKSALKLERFPMNVCITVDAETAPQGCVIYPAGQAIAVHHRGAYEELGAAYAALRHYVQTYNLTPSGPAQEVYMESTAEHRDRQDNYITKIILPVADRRKRQ